MTSRQQGYNQEINSILPTLLGEEFCKQLIEEAYNYKDEVRQFNKPNVQPMDCTNVLSLNEKKRGNMELRVHMRKH